MKEQDALVVLNAISGLGAVKIKRLMAFFDSAAGVLEQNYDDILASGIVAPPVVENIVHFSKDKFLSDEYNLGQSKGVAVLTFADESFPQSLRDIPGGPVVLYIWGSVDVLHAASVAMVGSRVCSHYGKAAAERFAHMFAQAGMVVVSGLARGIDTAAHQGCLNASGRTIAVVGCGLNHVYPYENKALMEKISRHGAVISEMPMNTPPHPANFPRRNRIISGLSLATVVVEAGEKSGALITAGYAAEQGRDVFAVPANIDYTTAEGSNRLIKDGALVALDPTDVLDGIKDQLEFTFPAIVKEVSPRMILSEGEMKCYTCLTSEPLHFDELLKRAECSLSDAAELMLGLELKGVVKQLPGKYYVKI